MTKFKLFILLPLLLVGCNKNTIIDDYKKTVEASILIKVATEKPLYDYFAIYTVFLKNDDVAYYYKSEYIGVDEYHNYYNIDYLSAINDETIQIIELQEDFY